MRTSFQFKIDLFLKCNIMQEEDYSSPNHQVSTDHNLPYPPPTAPSPVFPSWPAHCPPQTQQLVAQNLAGQDDASQAWLVSEHKKRRKKKRKSGSRQGGQTFDSPIAPTSSDPAAMAQYREDYETYLKREYGDLYTPGHC